MSWSEQVTQVFWLQTKIDECMLGNPRMLMRTFLEMCQIIWKLWKQQRKMHLMKWFHVVTNWTRQMRHESAGGVKKRVTKRVRRHEKKCLWRESFGAHSESIRISQSRISSKLKREMNSFKNNLSLYYKYR